MLGFLTVCRLEPSLINLLAVLAAVRSDTTWGRITIEAVKLLLALAELIEAIANGAMAATVCSCTAWRVIAAPLLLFLRCAFDLIFAFREGQDIGSEREDCREDKDEPHCDRPESVELKVVG